MYRSRFPVNGYETQHEFIIVENASFSYQIDSGFVAADAYGDKLVRKGQVVMASTAAGEGIGHVYPTHASYGLTAVGISKETVNLRNGDAHIGVLVDGWVDENFVIDNGIFGTVTSGHKTNMANIKFTKRMPII